MPRKYLFGIGFMGAAVAALAIAFTFSPSTAFAASLYFAPASKTVSVGENFTVAVDVSSADQAMNAASGDISFPSDKLRVLSVSNSGSVMNLWVQNPSFSNAASGGDINFAGVVLTPGFTGTGGNVVMIRFQAVAVGSAQLSFSTGSVLANDGNGTDILSSMGTAAITVTPAAPTPPSAPAQTQAAAPPAVATVPPAPFVVSEETNDPTDPQPIFTWSTTAQSGIAKYLVKIGDGDFFDASTIEVSSTPDTYQLPLQAPAANVLLTVDAYDNAGDVTEATTTFSVAPLPPPSITNYSKQLSSGGLLTAQGTAPTNANTNANENVKIYLQQSGDVLTFLAPVDSNGNWSFAQNVTVAGGNWSLEFQTVDARGAASLMTPPYPVAIGGWLDEAIQFLLTWGILILLALFLLALIVALAYYIVHRLRRFHLSLSRDLVRERKELRDDLKRIEKELEADRPSSKIDLSPAGLRKKQQLVHKEIEHLDEDLKRDIKDNE